MEEKKLVPKKRFKDFEGKWIPILLGDILKYEQPTKYIVNSDAYDEKYNIPVLTAGQSFLLGYTNEEYGVKNASENNPVIIFDDFTTGSHFVDFSFKVKSSALKILESKNDKFLMYFNYLLLQNILYVPESHERHWISIYSQFEVLAPNIEEQEKIEMFFKVLDERIANQERKIAKIKALKEAYLNEMFPQEGETVPKRRFKGFEGEWDEILLGDILEYEQPTKYIVDSDVYDEKYTVPVLTAGQSFLLGFTNERYGVREANENNPVIIFDDFTTGNHFVDFSFKVKSSALKILESINNKFLTYFSYLLLQNIQYEPENHERHWISIYSQFKVLVPSIEEQAKIGEFFKNLDGQIEAEEKKLEKLKKTKEAYLEEMFV